jgi:hypothetical protein
MTRSLAVFGAGAGAAITERSCHKAIVLHVLFKSTSILIVAAESPFVFLILPQIMPG